MCRKCVILKDGRFLSFHIMNSVYYLPMPNFEKTPLINVDHITKDYGSGRGIFDVDFKLYKGECLGFLGPNGAGKSTTIRHIIGFSTPDKGMITIEGLDARKQYDKTLRYIGYVPGEIALPSGVNGNEFLTLEQSLSGVHNDELKNELIEYFEISKSELKVDTKRMSLGNKRKLAIISAFMNDPDILILDEPTSGLDHKMQEKFIELVKKEQAKGKTILLSSHIFSEVDACCTRVLIIKDGKLVSEITTDSLKNASNQSYTVVFKNKEDLNSFKESHPNLTYFLIEKENTLFFGMDDKDINDLLKDLSKYEIVSFSNKKESLEDFFMKFYQSNKKFEVIK